MPRYRLTIEYFGEGFVGWQRQKNGRGVQQAVEEALRRLDPSVDTIIAAGRTDAGVHALGQVVHCDLVKAWEPHTLRRAVNHFLRPERVAVREADAVADDFSARFSATARHYRYRIIQRSAPLAIQRGQAWQVHRPLDVAAMRAGAAHLLGKHDFTTFRAVHCQAKSPVKTLDRLDIAHLDDDEIRCSLSARSFLHNQVRSIVGTLVHVGRGDWPPERVGEALRARDRAACGIVAPPDGLYLERVDYGSSDT